MEADVLKKVLSVSRMRKYVRRISRKYVSDMIKKKRCVRQPAVSIARMHSVSKAVLVAINIPGFIEKVKEGDIEAAYQVISESSALPAVCGRVCPQESQCEGKCIRGIKGEPVSIGKLERFVADWARENNIKPEGAKERKGKKVAVIGSWTGRSYLCGRPCQDGI